MRPDLSERDEAGRGSRGAASPAVNIRGAHGRPLTGRWDRLRAWANMIVVDHGVFRQIYLNFHPVGGHAFRSSQPAPNQFGRLRARGVRTVVNLRGGRDFGSYPLEKEACRRHGMAFEELTLRSRATPTLATLEEVAALLERIEYPALFHCKAGADRVGLMSALYLLLREKRPAAEAKRQLALRFGHVRQGKTGVLDAFIEAFEADGGDDLMDWARNRYDAAAVTRAFQSRGWADLIVDKLLDRE